MSLLTEARSEIIAGMRFLRLRGRGATEEYRQLSEQLERADRFADALRLAFEEQYAFAPPDDYHGFPPDLWDRADKIFSQCYSGGVSDLDILP